VKFAKIAVIKSLLLTIILLSSCELFLGPEPDISPPGILKGLWNDFNNIYAYLDFRMSHNLYYNDWHDVYYNDRYGYALRVNQNTSEENLYKECVNMLRELNDPHVGLHAPGKFQSSYVEDGEPFNLSYITPLLVNGDGKFTNFYYGKFSSANIGYIHIFGFTQDGTDPMLQTWGKAIDDIIKDLADTDAIILDIRNNRGGHIYVMEYIAARFASKQKEYLLSSNKNGPGPNDFQSLKTHIIIPANNRYTKPIILLTNKDTVSVSERFTIALRTQDHVTHMGTTTRGAFSVRMERPMVNGWFYSISTERVTDMNGKIYEGIGITPDIQVKYGNAQREDLQIKAALQEAVR